MPNAGPQGPYRKSLAIKHLDGEPLTRQDIQFNMLCHLFENPNAVFTDPYPTIRGRPAGTKVTFRDLYVNALVNSAKCSKVTKDKLLDTPEFGVEFSKISLLSNVGRINTTMAFFPEMRTALRTYHPVPSLQKTDGNLQDAPRIKNILKSCFTPSERQNPPLTPADVLARSRSGEVPATSIVNMMFVFAGHAAIIAQTHFGSQTAHDMLDFFCPVNISSESRARAILWLCYHYLEAPSPNPFEDEYARLHPGKIPELVMISEKEAVEENIEPADEKEWGERMSAQRKVFMAKKDKEAEDAGEELPEGNAPREKPGKGRSRSGKARLATGRKKAGGSKLGTDDRDSTPSQQIFFEDNLSLKAHSSTSVFPTISSYHPSPAPIPSSSYFASIPATPPMPQTHSRTKHEQEFPLMFPASRLARARGAADPYPNRSRSPLQPALQTLEGGPSRSRQRKPRERRQPPTPAPLRRHSSSHDRPSVYSRQNSAAAPSSLRREGLEQAFYMVMNTDPLEDSEDEEMPDENTRHDLLLRLRIINRLRGKEPTPEPEHIPMDPVPFTYTRSR
ncbi:hypothetical protein BXZ70DRAFT_937962 [Cristinia sonorae]|uniref:Ino eighty subunit 1 n=1 Tax=Cristinia sonorae TaxID=1940300 RepID=A0A8K0XQG2_9AGAR|nr:hypothetical protein BXZ70DRAFT_937962 [Cristinia sonorae]